MRLLLDANAFVWWVTDSPRLTAKARAAIADAANDVVVGIGALWELAIKRSLQKLHFPLDFETVLNDEISRCSRSVLPICAHSMRCRGIIAIRSIAC